MKLLIISMSIILSGCASQIQIASSYDSASVVSVRATADLNLKIAEQMYCTMSVDTLNRHPEAVEGVKAICWSNSKATASDAASVLITPLK